jgi:hypothetical protein
LAEEPFATAAPVSQPAGAPPRHLPLVRDPCDDLVRFNSRRDILDAVGREALARVAEDYLDLLETS